MSASIEQPCPTVRQESGKDPEGRDILSVLVKRTYVLPMGGDRQLAEEQLPLLDEPRFDPEDEALLVEDTDLFPYKPRTDVVLKGHAYGYSGERKFQVSIRVGDAAKQILVQGERRCTLAPSGKVLFSDPEPADRIPLSYTHAYGGCDEAAEAVAADYFSKRSPQLDPKLVPFGPGSLFRYPRNPCGCGYLLRATPGALERLRLPNLEDPLDPLGADRLEVDSMLAWPRMPLPQATDWVSYAWFPRIAGVGVIPRYEGAEHPFAEANRGYFPEPVVRPARYDQADAFHLTCGASLGLQLPYLRGGEPVTLQKIHPSQPDLSFRLPAERPRIWTDGRKGKLNQTEPVIHTVVIEPDEDRISVVWRGSAPALRPYLPQELEKMPLRVEWAGG